MEQKERTANKELFQELCHKYIKREGLDRILAYLDKTDFYDAPSSASFHLNEKGGLCRHSINVFQTALKLNEHVAMPAIDGGESPLSLIHI